MFLPEHLAYVSTHSPAHTGTGPAIHSMLMSQSSYSLKRVVPFAAHVLQWSEHWLLSCSDDKMGRTTTAPTLLAWSTQNTIMKNKIQTENRGMATKRLHPHHTSCLGHCLRDMWLEVTVLGPLPQRRNAPNARSCCSGITFFPAALQRSLCTAISYSTSAGTRLLGARPCPQCRNVQPPALHHSVSVRQIRCIDRCAGLLNPPDV